MNELILYPLSKILKIFLQLLLGLNLLSGLSGFQIGEHVAICWMNSSFRLMLALLVEFVERVNLKLVIL